MVTHLATCADGAIHLVIQNSKPTYVFEVGDCFVFENTKD